MATLHVLQGPDHGRTYDTSQEPAVIGRSTDQIQLSDHSVSRRHALLRPDNGKWVLEDLKSSNGTFLNGRRVVGPTTINHGDQIKVGSSLMVFTGTDQVENFSGPSMIHDLVDLSVTGQGVDSSILSAVASSEESVILQPPETADAVAAWNVVYKIVELIGAIESVNAFLERVADIILDHLVVDRLVLLMRESGSGEMTPQIVRFRDKDQRTARQKIVASKTIINHVIETKDGVLCANAMTDARFTEENSQDSIHRLGLRSVICFPILSRDTVEGVVHLDCSMSHHTYTLEQLRLAVSIGRLAGVAIDNMRLVESRMHTERLAATGETAAYLSHHIRNILQGMRSGADVVEMGLKREKLESIAAGWDIVKRNLDRILQLTVNMLTFSKDRRPRIEMAQVNKVIEEVAELVQHRADEKSVILLTDYDDLPAIATDPEGVHQAVHNIALNAIDAANRESGRVNIQTRYDAELARVSIVVSDNGPGIAQDQAEHIFQAFQSFKGQSGTGLGLAAARKIVRELGGQVEFESRPGEGTTFFIHLPAERGERAESEKTHGPPDVPVRR